MNRRAITNIVGCGIIYPAFEPTKLFIEVKDDGLPLRVFRRGLCPIGGNWIGEHARNDKNPFGTFSREVAEELTLERSAASTLELGLLGQKPEEDFYFTPRADLLPSEEDKRMLSEIIATITKKAFPFGDYLITIPKAVIDRGNPQNTNPGYKPIYSYYLVPLSDSEWNILLKLQKKFGNLSCESITVVTSLHEIMRSKLKFAFGHDVAIRDFYIQQGFREARDSFPLFEGISTEYIGMPHQTYEEYLERYDVLRKPI